MLEPSVRDKGGRQQWVGYSLTSSEATDSKQSQSSSRPSCRVGVRSGAYAVPRLRRFTPRFTPRPFTTFPPKSSLAQKIRSISVGHARTTAAFF